MQHSKQNNDTNAQSELSNEMLVNMIQAGINVKYNKEILIKKNMGLVYKVARACTYHIPMEDKVQYCLEGMLLAIDGFRDTGGKFSTYAHITMRNFIYRHGMGDNNFIQIPSYLSNNAITVNRFRDQFIQIHQQEPSIETVSKETGVSIQAVKSILVFKNHVTSMDVGPSDDSDGSQTLQNFLSSPEPQYNLGVENFINDDVQELEIAMKKLSSTERRLLSMYYGLDGNEPMTAEDIIAYGFKDFSGKEVTSIHVLYRTIKNITATLRKQINILQEN